MCIVEHFAAPVPVISYKKLSPSKEVDSIEFIPPGGTSMINSESNIISPIFITEL